MTFYEYSWSDSSTAVVEPAKHPLVDNINAVIDKYSLQSAGHFALYLKALLSTTARVNKTNNHDDNALVKGSKVPVLFWSSSKEIQRNCRPFFRKDSVMSTDVLTDEIQVHDRKRWVSLLNFLTKNFPANPDLVTEDKLRLWWDANGKTFNWAGLPTELKDAILQSCVCNPHGYSDYYYKLQRYKKRYHRKPGPYEIVDHLGNWNGLLSVDRQTRAIALRLLLEGNDKYPAGLAVFSQSMKEFKGAMFRLANHYQINENTSVPRYPRERMLARQYKHFPKQYPHLSRFATMRHGIRKLYLEFNFLDALFFFKVTVGKFHLHRTKYYETCDILEKLPNLDGVWLALPRKWWFDRPLQLCPRLFDEIHPCPRTLHRYIYENAAKTLAPYKHVRVFNFMDGFEELRFWDLYKTAAAHVRFTNDEHMDLYKECGGGIQVDDASEVKFDASKTSTAYSFPVSNPDLFPPRCNCDEPCRDAFERVGKY